MFVYGAPLNNVTYRNIYLQNRIHPHQSTQKHHIDNRKPQKIFPLFAQIFPGNLLIGDQTCHRSDECAKSAEVGADDKCLVIRCKSRQQKGGWHVADNLAGTDCDVCFPSGNDAFEEGLESWHTLHISDEHEKSDKCAKQCIVHVKQSFSRYKQEQYKNNHEQDADV